MIASDKKIEERVRESLDRALRRAEPEVERRYSALGLRRNPFPFASIGPSSDLLGLPPLRKDQIESIMSFLGAERPALLEIVGDYGTGKTHILLWLKRIVEAEAHGEVGAYYIANPGVTPRDLVAAITRAIGDEDLGHRIRILVIRGYQKVWHTQGYRGVRDLFTKESVTLHEDTLEKQARELAGEDLCLNDTGWMKKADIYVQSRAVFLDFASKTLTEVGIPRGVASEFASFAFSGLESGSKSWAVLSLSKGSERFTYEDHYRALVTLMVGTGYKRILFLIDEIEDVVASGRVTRRQSSEYLAALRIVLDLTVERVGIVLAATPRAWARLKELYGALDDRRTNVVDLGKLSKVDAEEIVRNYLDTCRVHPNKDLGTLKPFSKDALVELVSQCNGSPRMFIGLCHESLDFAVKKGLGDISRTTVRELLKSYSTFD
jgi:hypothetical protein